MCTLRPCQLVLSMGIKLIGERVHLQYRVHSKPSAWSLSLAWIMCGDGYHSPYKSRPEEGCAHADLLAIAPA